MKKVFVFLLVLTMIFVLVGCNDQSSEDSQDISDAQTVNEDATEQEDQTTSEEIAEEEDYTYETEYWSTLNPDDIVTWEAPNNYMRVGMLVPDGTNEFYVGIVNSAEAVLSEAGYELLWTSINNPETAIAAVETWTLQGIDALIVMAQDTSCEKVCLDAMEQGVLLVLGSATFESYHVWCCQDYYDIGYQTAKMAADWLSDNYGDDASYVTFGMNNAEFQTLKTQGVEEGMKEFYPDGNCVGNIISADVTTDMETILIQNPDLDAVVTWHAYLSLQALNAAKAANRAIPGEFFVFGSQMTAQSLLEIQDPNSCYIADTWMGDQGKQYANVVLTLLQGGEVNHWDYAPPYIVDENNVDTYYDDYYAWLESN